MAESRIAKADPKRVSNAYAFSFSYWCVSFQVLSSSIRCQKCRVSKLKCSGTAPCARCRRQGIQCIYEDKLGKSRNHRRWAQIYLPRYHADSVAHRASQSLLPTYSLIVQDLIHYAGMNSSQNKQHELCKR